MQKLYLGLDGGGTKTKAVLIDQDKNVISKAESPGSNANVIGVEPAVENVYTAIKAALPNNTNGQKLISVFAIAGVDTSEEKHAWEKALSNHKLLSSLFEKPPQIVNDTVAALRSGSEEKNGIVLISGTGSNCYGVYEGKEAKSSGVGHILSDDGSAFDIGLKIIRTATKAIDGRGPKTALLDLLFEKFKINSINELKNLVYQKPWDKTDIAQIAPLAEKAAEKNDKIAIQIIDDAAEELAQAVIAVAKNLEITNKQYTIVLTGSVLENLKVIQGKLKNKIHKVSPKAKFTLSQVDSATAAAYLAQEYNQ